MSLFHYIKLKERFDLDALNDRLGTIEGIEIEERGEDCYYYWIAEKSTRGFDITLENEQIEVRNTVLSNETDYLLTNIVVKTILAITGALVLDEEGIQVNGNLLFDDSTIKKLEIRGCEVTKILSNENEDIAIYGPVRKVHFGKKLYQAYKHLEGEELKKYMFGVIKKVQYGIPDYGFGDVLTLGNGKSLRIIKMLFNSGDLLIDKYDFIGFEGDGDSIILITNSVLNNILPSEWDLVDEFTIIAPEISPVSFANLVLRAKAFDIFKEVFGDKN